MAVSLKSIAEELGLSIATVSWILSGQGEERGFSAATIKLVKSYAKKVGYRPNLLARSLSKGHTKTLGLIIPSISDPFYSQMAKGVEEKAAESGYVMILVSSEGDEKKERRLIQTLLEQQVAGLIIAPTNKSDNVIRQLLKEKYPFVLVDRYIPELVSNYVIFDNEDSSYDLVTHLYSKGSRKVALITTDTHLFIMGMRRDGYRRAVVDSGNVCIDDLVVEVNRDSYQEDIISKLDVLFSREPDIDGLFFTTHYLAEEAIRYFITKGIDYHNRFRMASMHITKALEMLAPEMSYADIHVERIGGMSVEILLRNIQEKDNFVTEGVILSNKRVLI